MGREVAQAPAFLKPPGKCHHLARITLPPHDCVRYTQGAPPVGILTRLVWVRPVHETPKILPGDSVGEGGGEALTWTSSVVLPRVKGA